MPIIKWNGYDTLIRKERGGEQFPIKQYGTIEVTDEVAEDLKSVYGSFVQFVTEKAVVEPKKVEKSKK